MIISWGPGSFINGLIHKYEDLSAIQYNPSRKPLALAENLIPGKAEMRGYLEFPKLQTE